MRDVHTGGAGDQCHRARRPRHAHVTGSEWRRDQSNSPEHSRAGSWRARAHVPNPECPRCGSVQGGREGGCQSCTPLGRSKRRWHSTHLRCHLGLQSGRRDPSYQGGRGWGEPAAYLCLNVSKGDRSPCFFKEEEKTCAELIGRWSGCNPSMFTVALTAGHKGGHRDVEEANPAGFPWHGAWEGRAG